ncbi:acyl carrier protein [Roseinatronobacter alkalisoli]|uniref:Acyl carrier protein n=1 Tax=Roseinatronobacter alkalisoli TaxID=3028235 RepID=A0ABT5TI28_9RHOB|nr:acyl carrier protein [Roseinatronobacter sp. HJB301]MDD7973862.1 acyl carrier protein [Roseinatronobacter sp. HJB301]
MDDIDLRIKSIIAEKFGVDAENLTSDTSFTDDLAANSLDLVEISMIFEREFDIEVADVDVEALQTIADAEQLIRARV